MFELLVTLCLLADPTACRDVLVPGYEAATVEMCEGQLASQKPDLDWHFGDYKQLREPRCEPAGKTANFIRVANGVFAHRGVIADAAADNLGDVSNIGFVIGETSIAVIDSGGSRKIAEQVYRAIRKKSDLPISHVILTHMHPDHVLGASVFTDAGAKIVGHGGLKRALQDRARTYLDNFGRLIGAGEFIGTRVVFPDIVATNLLIIDLGMRKLEVKTWETSHTNTDITVLDAQSGVFFTGDLMFHEHAPALDGSLKGWRRALHDMKAMEVKMVVPGHGGPLLSWPAAAQPLTRYLAVLEKDTRSAINDGIRLGVAVKTIAESERRNWMLFDLFNPRNATVAYTELEWE